MRTDLTEKLAGVERIAGRSKWARLLGSPVKYLTAIGYRQAVYPFFRKGWLQRAPTFFGRDMWVMLPSGTDIFLTGGKSHGSEIRLARFLIQRLRPGDHVLDIGGHFGYFTLLSAELVGKTGQVRVFEPSAPTFALLRDNIAGLEQVMAEPKAVSYDDEPLVFYEFPPLFSEYNSTDISQFAHEDWFKQNPPLKKEVPAVSMDHLTGSGGFRPQWIKIDAEGGELSVVRGGQRYLRERAPTLVMEYLEPSRNNAPHRAAAELLYQWGYRSHAIGGTGELLAVDDLDAHLQREGLDSDNIVFAKPGA